MDALDELENEFEVEADRRMNNCDRCGPSVSAKIYVAMPEGNELRFCYHCANRSRAKLNDLGAFLYELSA